MKITILPSKLNGTVDAPPSKSYMHRTLICAAAADKATKIRCESFSNDIMATLSCLEKLGAKFSLKDGYITVYPIKKENSAEMCVLDCGESGSTLRFMLPFAASLGKKCVFVGAERLGQRPLSPLCDALEKNGAKISFEKDSFLPCRLSGQLRRGTYKIPGDISSQFITGLLLAMGAGNGGEIEVEGALKSAPYVDITADIQKKFGVTAKKSEKGYIIKEPCGYISPGEAIIEGDFSNAAFWLVAGAIGSKEKITCRGLFENSLQGDGKIFDILRSMGADIRREGESVTVYKSKLKGTELDCSHIPDIVPILCVAASQAEGKSVFYNIERLREKESDRVKTTVDMLSALGCRITADENSITVFESTLSGGGVTSANDHRIAMSAAVASLVCENPVTIDDAQAVSKSYPDFYEKFQMLGGKCK